MAPPPCPLSRPTRPLSVLFGHWRLSVGVYVQFTRAERSQFHVLLWNKTSLPLRSDEKCSGWAGCAGNGTGPSLGGDQQWGSQSSFCVAAVAACLVIIHSLNMSTTQAFQERTQRCRLWKSAQCTINNSLLLKAPQRRLIQGEQQVCMSPSCVANFFASTGETCGNSSKEKLCQKSWTQK